MSLRSYSALIVVIFLMTAPAAAAAESPTNFRLSNQAETVAQTSILDFDGDGISDDLDPDDDNDEVTDAEDHDPHDPNVQHPPVVADDTESPGDTGSVAPPPVQVDPVASNLDSDGDGIPNDLDPDDSNNAVTDEDEPNVVVVDPTPNPTTVSIVNETPTVVPNVTEVTQPTSAPADTFVPEAVAPVPVVASLPSTGSGVQNTLPSLVILVVALIGLAAVRSRSNNSSK